MQAFVNDYKNEKIMVDLLKAAKWYSFEALIII